LEIEEEEVNDRMVDEVYWTNQVIFVTSHDIVKKYTDIEYLEALLMTSNYY
jgi:hypothetical protein